MSVTKFTLLQSSHAVTIGQTSTLTTDPGSEDLAKACWDSSSTKGDIKNVGSVTALSFRINFCAAADSYINLTALSPELYYNCSDDSNCHIFNLRPFDSDLHCLIMAILQKDTDNNFEQYIQITALKYLL